MLERDVHESLADRQRNHPLRRLARNRYFPDDFVSRFPSDEVKPRRPGGIAEFAT